MKNLLHFQVKTSYIDATLPRALRQASLMETYNFHCRCTACAAPADADPRESVWCPKSCGGTCPILAEGLADLSSSSNGLISSSETALSRCIKCNAALKNSDAVQDAVRIGQEALDKATALEFKGFRRLTHCHCSMSNINTLPSQTRPSRSNSRQILSLF